MNWPPLFIFSVAGGMRMVLWCCFYKSSSKWIGIDLLCVFCQLLEDDGLMTLLAQFILWYLYLFFITNIKVTNMKKCSRKICYWRMVLWRCWHKSSSDFHRSLRRKKMAMLMNIFMRIYLLWNLINLVLHRAHFSNFDNNPGEGDAILTLLAQFILT